eukprot:6172428-Pleurochrysis_carterae.AAC.1
MVVGDHACDRLITFSTAVTLAPFCVVVQKLRLELGSLVAKFLVRPGIDERDGLVSAKVRGDDTRRGSQAQARPFRLSPMDIARRTQKCSRDPLPGESPCELRK